MKTKWMGLVLAFVVLSGMSSIASAQGGNQNPGVAPPGANYRGLSYQQWEAIWWQTVFATPIVDGYHPVFSGGAMQGPKGVLLVTGVFAGEEPAELELTIPAGTPLFVAIVNSECSVFEPDPFHGDDEAELRECANFHIDNVSGVFASLDGRPVKNISAYRFESPLFVWGPLPADNIFGAPEGTTSPAVDAGYYLMLKPLSVGEHVLEFGGTFDLFGASINTRYHITVTP